MLVFHDVMSARVSGCLDHATFLRISLKYCSAINFDFRATDQEEEEEEMNLLVWLSCRP